MQATDFVDGAATLRGAADRRPQPRPEAITETGGPLSRKAAGEVSTIQNLRSFLVAFLFAALVLSVSGALGLLIATTFYGYGGLG